MPYFVLCVQTFHQDVVAHASDVENVKANGEELIGTQPAVKPNVQRTTGKQKFLYSDCSGEFLLIILFLVCYHLQLILVGTLREIGCPYYQTSKRIIFVVDNISKLIFLYSEILFETIDIIWVIS